MLLVLLTTLEVTVLISLEIRGAIDDRSRFKGPGKNSKSLSES
jgi:hypothetical protein